MIALGRGDSACFRNPAAPCNSRLPWVGIQPATEPCATQLRNAPPQGTAQSPMTPRSEVWTGVGERRLAAGSSAEHFSTV